MDPSSLRRLLKSARTHLAEKNPHEALVFCKQALQADPECYEALVLVGKAAFHVEEYQQAEAAYTRATALDGTNLLAWQGLAELHTHTAAWEAAYDVQLTLAQLAATSADPAIVARAPAFTRRAAEAAMSAGLFAESETLWRELLDSTQLDARDPARVDILCHLAAAQLAAEDAELEARIEVAPLHAGQEAVERDLLEADWARAGLEREDGSAAATLREIIAEAPPSPPFAAYYDAYLQRLRKAAHGAPVGSMERHSRRAAVLNFALHAIRGMNGRGDVQGGCCTPGPFEAALAMLEVEGNVAGGGGGLNLGFGRTSNAQLAPGALSPSPSFTATRQPSGGHVPAAVPSGGGAALSTRLSAVGNGGVHGSASAAALLAPHSEAWHSSAGGGTQQQQQLAASRLSDSQLHVPQNILASSPGGPDLQITGMERVAKRLVHNFPWAPSAAVHLGLCLRRAQAGLRAPRGPVGASHGGGVAVTDLNRSEARHGGRPRVSLALRRRRLIKLLLGGLRKGGAASASTAGWLAASELLLEEGAPEAALDAAKQGLTYLAARELLGHEALVQADLLLKLAAGRALACMAGVPPPGPGGYTMEVLAAVRAHQLQAAATASSGSGDGGSPAALRDGDVFPHALRARVTRVPQRGPPGGAERTALEAVAWLRALLLSGRVCGGHAPFARLAGSIADSDLVQQATRCLAQLALVLEDVQRAREMYEGLVGAAALGRVDPYAVSHWALAEYGALLAGQGECSAALAQLEAAVKSQAAWLVGADVASCPEAAAAQACLTARYHLLAAHVAWELGGDHRSQRGSGAHHHLLTAAAAAEAAVQTAGGVDNAAEREALADAADAFCLLGCWYAEHGADMVRAAKCFQRSLGIDPTQELAGQRLVLLLLKAGSPEAAAASALAVCDSCIARAAEAQPLPHAGDAAGLPVPPPLWAVRTAARLRLQGKQPGLAMNVLQGALRAVPGDATLWELLGASYQQQGRITSALRAYARALALSPRRTYCLLQSGVLLQHQGELSQALRAFERALALAPTHPAALLGAGECQLALVVRNVLEGALGAAGAALAAAVQHAATCTRHHPRLLASWKLLGDALLQGADVPTREAAQASQGPTARAATMAAARKAYARALHLDPTQGGVWGDAAMAAFQEADILWRGGAGASGSGSTPTGLLNNPARLHQLATRLVHGGLRLAPTDHALWARAGEMASAASGAASDGSAGAARAEFCLSRALELNPSHGPAWATLARLYSARGEQGLAAAAAERCRLAEPRLVAGWEAMAALAVPEFKAVGDASYGRQLDAWEHAVGLGGAPESCLGYATGAVVAGLAEQGDVLASATRAAAALPHVPAAANTLGLALEAHGPATPAVHAYHAALDALSSAAPITGRTHVVDILGAPGAESSAPTDARVAVQLNLARALLRAGRPAEAVELYERLLPEAAPADGTVRAAYALALLQAGSGDVTAAVKHAEAGLAAAQGVLERSGPGGTPGAAAAALRRQLGCVHALLHAYLWAGRPAEAVALVRAQAAGLPHGAGPEAAALLVRAWLVLLATALPRTDSGPQLPSDDVSQAWPVTVAELGMQAVQWAGSRTDVDDAWVAAAVAGMHAALASAAQQPRAALGHALRAAHVCPWDRSWRLRAVAAAVAAGACPAASVQRLLPATQAAQPPWTPPTARTRGTAAMRHLPLSAIPIAGGAGGPHPRDSAPSHLALVPALPDDSAAPQEPCVQEVAATAALALQPGDPRAADAAKAATASLLRAVHAAPSEPSGWYLLALMALQQAAAAGQARMYVTALSRCRIALSHTRHALARIDQQPSAGGGGEARRALSHAGLRLLVAVSECLLHSRQPGCLGRAKDAATESLRWALQHGISPGAAHRQLARVAAASGDTANADLALSNAVASGDAPALLDYAHLAARMCLQQTSAGDAPPTFPALDAALAALEDAGPGTRTPRTVDGPLARSCRLLQAELAASRQDGAGAKTTLLAALQDDGRGPPLPALAAARVLQSHLAAGLARSPTSAEGQTPHQLAVEARWAANKAIQVLGSQTVTVRLVGGGGGGGGGGAAGGSHLGATVPPAPTVCLAHAHLGLAELLLNKPDRARPALEQALRAAPCPGTAAALRALLGATAASPPDGRQRARSMAYMVHANPTSRAAWDALRASA